MLLPQRNKVLECLIFCIDLLRLIFKWMIHMGQLLDDITFRKTSKGVRLLGFLINKWMNIPDELRNLHLLPEMKHIGDMVASFLDYEFMENSYIFHLFASAIESFYIKGMKCKDLEKEYFHGRFNNNMLLKFIILMYDPRGEMKQCITGNEENKSLNQTKPDIKAITLEYLEELKLRGPEGLGCKNPILISRLSLEFILNSNRKIAVTYYPLFLSLLKKLMDIGLPTKPLSEFIEFNFRFGYGDGNDNNPTKWNQAYFEKFLEESKKEMTDKQYLQCQKLLY